VSYWHHIGANYAKFWCGSEFRTIIWGLSRGWIVVIGRVFFTRCVL